MLAFPSAPNQKASQVQIHVVWKGPSMGWLKLNTESSVKHIPDSVGIGGIMQNERGEWINGFHGRVGMCSV